MTTQSDAKGKLTLVDKTQMEKLEAIVNRGGCKLRQVFAEMAELVQRKYLRENFQSDRERG